MVKGNTSMNYTASVKDYFQPAKWLNNTLLGAVATLIPVIGPVVLSGWHITILWNPTKSNDPKDYPPFDFQHFSKYLQRGLWPFVVNLVASLVLVPIAMFLTIPVFLLVGFADSQRGGEADALVFLIVPIVFLIQIVLALAYQLVATPLSLRATLTQDFKKSFDLGFIRDFVARMWKDMVVTALFMFGLGICLMIITVITCYIGMFFAMPVVMFAWHHLQKQLYQEYLSRGGRPIPVSPTLTDGPPPLY